MLCVVDIPHRLNAHRLRRVRKATKKKRQKTAATHEDLEPCERRLLWAALPAFVGPNGTLCQIVQVVGVWFGLTSYSSQALWRFSVDLLKCKPNPNLSLCFLHICLRGSGKRNVLGEAEAEEASTNVQYVISSRVMLKRLNLQTKFQKLKDK